MFLVGGAMSLHLDAWMVTPDIWYDRSGNDWYMTRFEGRMYGQLLTIVFGTIIAVALLSVAGRKIADAGFIKSHVGRHEADGIARLLAPILLFGAVFAFVYDLWRWNKLYCESARACGAYADTASMGPIGLLGLVSLALGIVFFAIHDRLATR